VKRGLHPGGIEYDPMPAWLVRNKHFYRILKNKLPETVKIPDFCPKKGI
jgi:hypothetical protein